MQGLDTSTLPIWLAVVLFLINLFREQLSVFVPQAVKDHFKTLAARRADRQEHEQDIEQALLDSRLQTSANEALRVNRLEGQLIEALHRKDSFIEKQLDMRLSEQQDLLRRNLEQVSHIRSNGSRTNDLLTAMNGNLTRLNDLLAASPGKINYVAGYIDPENESSVAPKNPKN